METKYSTDAQLQYKGVLVNMVFEAKVAWKVALDKQADFFLKYLNDEDPGTTTKLINGYEEQARSILVDSYELFLAARAKGEIPFNSDEEYKNEIRQMLKASGTKLTMDGHPYLIKYLQNELGGMPNEKTV